MWAHKHVRDGRLTVCTEQFECDKTGIMVPQPTDPRVIGYISSHPSFEFRLTPPHEFRVPPSRNIDVDAMSGEQLQEDVEALEIADDVFDDQQQEPATSQSTEGVTGYAAHTKSELIELASALGIQVDSRARKVDVIAALVKATSGADSTV